MYVVKIYKEKEILDVKHYKTFENVVADISDLTIFDNTNVPDDILESCTNPPRLYYAGESEDGVADDFEFRFKNGVYVYAGRILTEEEKERINKGTQTKYTACQFCECSTCNNEVCNHCDKCSTEKASVVIDCDCRKSTSKN